jgi:hypothetical protein
MTQREHETAGKQNAPAGPQSAEPRQPAQNALLHLQSLAGNRAVTRAIAVQRIGDNYLNQLPPELLQELGARTAHPSAGNVAGALSQAVRDVTPPRGEDPLEPGKIRANAVRLGRVRPFKECYELLKGLRDELHQRREGVRANQRVPPAGTLDWIDGWVKRRARLETDLLNVATPEAMHSLLWLPANNLITSLPRTTNAVHAFITN